MSKACSIRSRRWKRRFRWQGEVGRTKLKEIKVKELCESVLGGENKLDPAEWGQKKEEKQDELHQRLIQVRDSLHVAAGLDGPTDPAHIMHAEFASNKTIALLALVGVVLAAGLLFEIIDRWDTATGTNLPFKTQTAVAVMNEFDNVQKELDEARVQEAEARERFEGASDADRRQAEDQLKRTTEDIEKQRDAVADARARAEQAALDVVREIRNGGATEKGVLAMVVLLGALGGTLHLIGSLVKYVGNRRLRRSWVLHYFSMPAVGAALAPIVYMMLRVGILSPQGIGNGGSAIASLNLIAIYAFAALTGLFAKTASDKLGEVFRTLFRTAESPSKDSIGSEQPPGSSTSPGG